MTKCHLGKGLVSLLSAQGCSTTSLCLLFEYCQKWPGEAFETNKLIFWNHIKVCHCVRQLQKQALLCWKDIILTVLAGDPAYLSIFSSECTACILQPYKHIQEYNKRLKAPPPFLSASCFIVHFISTGPHKGSYVSSGKYTSNIQSQWCR